MNILSLIRQYIYEAFVVLSLLFAVPFMLAGDLGYLWAFLTLSLSLGLRKVAHIGRDVRLMRESITGE